MCRAVPAPRPTPSSTISSRPVHRNTHTEKRSGCIFRPMRAPERSATIDSFERFIMLATERVQTVVIGAGQSGLSAGYYLSRQKLPFVILDANAHVGDSWRRRWDSLRLFTAARFDALPGMRFPAPPRSFPTKD